MNFLMSGLVNMPYNAISVTKKATMGRKAKWLGGHFWHSCDTIE
jgi:hypothetical protein